MSFDVAADAYDRFMGRYSVLLSPQLAHFAGVRAGQRVLDVGSGPGALTTELVSRLGAEAVTAVDPSTPFVDAVQGRNPGVEVHQASAEQLPFTDDAFDASLAQLVVHFMTDPVAGLAEMRRVTRSGGIVAACVWDLAGGRAPLSPFWRAAHKLQPAARDESAMAGARQGHLREIFEAAGLTELEETELEVAVVHETFDEWWEPYTAGVGPAGGYVKSLSAEQQEALREACRRLLPPEPFTLTSVAWAVRGRA